MTAQINKYCKQVNTPLSTISTNIITEVKIFFYISNKKNNLLMIRKPMRKQKGGRQHNINSLFFQKSAQRKTTRYEENAAIM